MPERIEDPFGHELDDDPVSRDRWWQKTPKPPRELGTQDEEATVRLDSDLPPAVPFADAGPEPGPDDEEDEDSPGVVIQGGATIPRADERGERALYNAAINQSCPEGMCLRETRLYYKIPPRYSSAYQCWIHIPASRRHGTRSPRGYPVFFARPGSSPGFGHIAPSLGNGIIRSTDWPRIGMVSNVHEEDLAAAWGMTRLGWAYDINGYSVWARTIDATKMLWVAEHSPHTGGAVTGPMIKSIEDRLRRLSYLAASEVNTRWDGKTTVAWKKLENRYHVTQNGRPSLTELRRLGRMFPYQIAKP